MIKLWWLIPLAAMAFLASYQDIKYRKIPNGVALSVAVLGVFFVCIERDYSQFLIPLITLCLGMVLFKLNILAAGDSKLFAAFSLMIAPSYVLLTLWVISAIGGVLAIGLWGLSRLTKDTSWIDRGVPYGVPICIGSLLGIAASL